VAFLTALAQIYEWMEDREGLIRTLRTLLELKPNDAELCREARAAAERPQLLERAAELGCREPRVYRVLAETRARREAPRGRGGALPAVPRARPGDAESHFALGELTGDRSEYDLAWSLLAAGERKIRARILIYARSSRRRSRSSKEDRTGRRSSTSSSSSRGSRRRCSIP
jgi:hypothetical protein